MGDIPKPTVGNNATAKYRVQQGLAPITQSYDPKLVGWIVQAAKVTGADPKALLATAIQESGARFGAVGDGGTSYGPFQFHRGGALANHDAAWANSYDAVLNRAQEFARLKVHAGPGAAAVQRPQDRNLYSTGVNSHLSQAASILAKFGITGQVPSTSNTDVVPSPSQTPPKTLLPSSNVIPSPTINSGSESVSGASPLQALLSYAMKNTSPSKSGSGDDPSGILNLLTGTNDESIIPAPTITGTNPTPRTYQATTNTDPTITGTPGKKVTVDGFTVDFTPGKTTDWAGTHQIADQFRDLAQHNGLKVMSEKRDRKLTTSGNPSDHWVGSKGSYAFDMSNGTKPTPQMDRYAADVAKSLGVYDQWKKQGFQGILNVTKDGYRYQMLYRTDQGGNHYNHVHLGIKRV